MGLLLLLRRRVDDVGDVETGNSIVTLDEDAVEEDCEDSRLCMPRWRLTRWYVFSSPLPPPWDVFRLSWPDIIT